MNLMSGRCQYCNSEIIELKLTLDRLLRLCPTCDKPLAFPRLAPEPELADG